MKILIFANEFPPVVGGAGVVAAQNAYTLSLYGHDVTVLTRKRSGMDMENIYKIVEVAVFSKFWFLSYRKAVDFASFDIIILNDLASAYVAGLYFSSTIFSKSIIILHGSEAGRIYKKQSFAHILSFFKQVYISSLKRCKKIYAVSNYMKNMFISQTGLIELQEKIFVNYAGVDLKIFFPENDDDFRLKWHIPKDAILLLSVSRIIKDKGYYEKFCLFNELCKEGENLYWIIVGSGEYLETLKTLTRENGLDSRIIFTGPERRDKLRTFYSNADLFWLLSKREAESFGLVYLEAQACGIPVIGYNQVGVVEAVANGKSGFLVDNDEQVKTIIKEKLHKNLLKADILDYVKKFQIENTVKKLIDL
jgi:glycosyltransferase involved in cell wall biosynthesis